MNSDNLRGSTLGSPHVGELQQPAAPVRGSAVSIFKFLRALFSWSLYPWSYRGVKIQVFTFTLHFLGSGVGCEPRPPGGWPGEGRRRDARRTRVTGVGAVPAAGALRHTAAQPQATHGRGRGRCQTSDVTSQHRRECLSVSERNQDARTSRERTTPRKCALRLRALRSVLRSDFGWDRGSCEHVKSENRASALVRDVCVLGCGCCG
eukprot:2632356-Prymnesium_polylepis.1